MDADLRGFLILNARMQNCVGIITNTNRYHADFVVLANTMEIFLVVIYRMQTQKTIFFIDRVMHINTQTHSDVHSLSM